MGRRKTPADYHALAQERGFVWLGPEVPTVRTKTGWQCKEGHQWETCYSVIRMGYGCPYCSSTTAKTAADYHALAQKRDFVWLGPEVRNNHTPTGWQCRQEHRWKATYGTIHEGKGCPYCAGNAPKTPDDYHALAQKRGFVWTGPEAPNIRTKTGWQCEFGHHWQTTYNNIRSGNGCPHCFDERRSLFFPPSTVITPEDYHDLAESRGFTWLGPEVRNTITPTMWECKFEHRWKARYSSIKQGSGCPYCAGVAPKTPDDYHALAQKKGFVWLGPMVVNTHAVTHWQCRQGHQWQSSYSRIAKCVDCPHCLQVALKTPDDYHALAKKRDFIWLGPEAPNIATPTGWQCRQGHQWQAKYYAVRDGTGCPYCAGNAPKTDDDYHALAQKRGFVWLGPVVSGVNKPTGWQCQQGHQWQARYSTIDVGSRCPHCLGVAPKIPDDYHALAKKRGFIWLGPEAPNIATPTGWQCRQGHRWQARYSSMWQGHGCPHCAGNASKRPDDYHALAQKRGFIWLGSEVINTATPTTWQCRQGHQWQARYSELLQGSGCPHCRQKTHHVINKEVVDE